MLQQGEMVVYKCRGMFQVKRVRIYIRNLFSGVGKNNMV